MDQKSRETLSEILARPISGMSEGEKAFVRARREYLTEAQTRDLAEVLESEEQKEEGEEAVDYSKLNKAGLEELCASRDIEVPEGATKAIMISLLEEADEKEEGEEAVDYSKLNKAGLEELCASRDIEVPEGATKAIMISLLEEADEKEEEEE